MTKYILQSGSVRKYPGKMECYFDELFSGIDGKTNILWCFFATESENRLERYKKYLEISSSYFPDQIKSENKLANTESFIEQVRWADVLFFQGGSTKLLMSEIKEFDLQALFEGKVVTGSSAGAAMLSEAYWSADNRICGNGFGLVPVKFGAHFYSDYGSGDPRGPIDWQAAKEELEAYGDTSLPVYALEEGEFVVFEK